MSNKSKNKIRTIFDRRKSGYTREFSLLDVFLFNVMGFSLGLALVSNPTFIGAFAPNANIVIVVLLGFALAFLNGLIYGWFGSIMPNTGGDFVFVSRTVSHRLGFLANWGFTFCQLYGFAMNIGMLISMSLIPTMYSIGISFNNSVFINISHFFSNNLIFSGIIIALFYLIISLFGLGFNKFITGILFLIGISGPIIIFITFQSSSNTEFVNAFNASMKSISNNPDTYNLIINLAKDSGMKISSETNFHESLKALPIGFLCFLGFTYSVYIGGEVENPRKSQMRGILSALFVGLLTFVLCMYQYISVVGQEFNSAMGNNGVLSEVGLQSNSMNYLASFLITNKWIQLVMQIGILVWFLIIPYIMMQVCIRNVIAWTTDGLLPDVFLKRMNKTNSPWISSILVSSIGILFIIIINLTGLSLVGAIGLAGIAYLITSIGAIILPYTNPNLFEKLPSTARSLILGFSSFQIIGFICVIGFLWIIYASISYPEISGGNAIRAIIMSTVIYVAGFLFYQWRKYKLKQKEIIVDINIDELFKEIPED